MKDNYNSTVRLLCATCGGQDFEFNDDKTYVKCNLCNREYLRGYDELVELNQETITLTIEEKKKEIVNDLKQDLLKAFKGNKNFRIG